MSSARDGTTELLAIFDIPRAALPRVVASTGPFPPARASPLPDGVPVGAVMGGSHALRCSRMALAPGPVKATLALAPR